MGTIGISQEEMHLIQQARREDVDFLKKVSNEDILNVRDSNDLSVLHHAVLKDQQDCVEVICERCPELVYHQAKFFSNMTALMLAVERGHPSMVQTIFEASIKVERDSNGGKKLLRMKDTDARTALWWAVCSNQLEVTNFLLEKDPDFEHGPDVNGITLLMAAEQYAKSNYLNAGKILELVIEHLKRNEDVKFLKTISKEDLLNARDSNDLSALHHAVLKDQQDCVQVICERCPELAYHQAKSVFNITPLMLAATRGNLSMIQTLLNASIDAEGDINGDKKLLMMEDTDKRNALWWAVSSHHFEVTEFLLKVDPDFKLGSDVNGDTLVMMAEQYAKLNYPSAGRILALVMEHQKRNEQRDTVLPGEQTSTPMTPSKEGGDAAIIHSPQNEGAEKEHIGTELLGAASREDGAVRNMILSVNNQKQNIVHLAARFGHVEIMKFILDIADVPADILNAQDINGNTPLHIAALSGNLDTATCLLLDTRVLKETINTKGQTILDAVLGMRKDVDFLKTVSQEDLLNARDSNDLSALHHAVLKNQQDCVAEICQRCPELVYHQAKSVFNMTPLMLAAIRGHVSMIPTILHAEPDSNGKKLLRMKDTDKRSALWWAICSQKFEVTKFLLAEDPDLELEADVNGDTVVMVAEKYAKLNYPDAGRILELVRSTLKESKTPSSNGAGAEVNLQTPVNVPAPASDLQENLIIVLLVLLIAIAVNVLIKI